MSKVKSRPRGGASIPCPRCKTPTRVLQTRRILDASVRRERQCPKCNHIFDTNEKPERTKAAA